MRIVLLFLLTASHDTARAFSNEDELLIGWKGDSYEPNSRKTWVEQIAWSPRAAIFHNFISDAEAREACADLPARLQIQILTSQQGGAFRAVLASLCSIEINEGVHSCITPSALMLKSFECMDQVSGCSKNVLMMDMHVGARTSLNKESHLFA